MRIKDLIYAGSRELEEHDPQKAICVGVNVMVLVNAVLCVLVGGLYAFLTRNVLLLGGVLGEVSLLSIPILANVKGRYYLANLSLYLIMCVVSFFFGAVIGKELDNATLMLVYLISVSFFLFSGATLATCLLLNFLLVVLLEYNYAHHLIPTAYVPSEATGTFIKWSVFTVIVFLTGLTFSMFAKSYSLVLLTLKRYASKVEKDLKEEEASNKNKVKFISTTYHEVDNFFAGQSSLLRRLSELENQNRHGDIREILNIIEGYTENMELLIKNILSWSRLEMQVKDEPYIELLDIKALFGNMIKANELIAREKNSSLTLLLDDSLPSYLASDRLKLLQIAHNLVSNALKHANGKGVILKLEKLPAEAWRMIVQDEGSGISESLLQKIFDPFVTERSNGNRNGIGLGLYITRELVYQLGGDISVSSKLNVGTRFTVTFPELALN